MNQSPLHVALNFLPLAPGLTGGMEVYARRLVPALLEVDPSLRLSILAGPEAAASIESGLATNRCHIHRAPLGSSGLLGRVLAEQCVLPAWVKRIGPDLLHNLFTTAPLVPMVPQVTTIHDLSFLHERTAHTRVRRLGLAALAVTAAYRSRALLTHTQYVAEDIQRSLRISGSRLYVAHPGPTPDDVTPASERELAAVLGVVPELLVYVPSPPRPHKNLDRLLQAVARIPEPIHVVATGYPTEHVPGFLALSRSLGLASRVHWLGWVEDRIVQALYRHATCVVFPSLAEGFGLPVLEAMARGVPVACSDRSSLPEVGGNAVLYFDPTSIESIAEATGRLVREPGLRRDLAERGRAQATRFTWTGCARATLRCYDAVARSLGRERQ
jgi:glycosyltransferase involved in cell wall biosynthesis